MNNDLVVVLDLGSSKAACLAASPDGIDGMKVEALATVPCKGVVKGVVNDLDEAAKAVDNVIRKVQSDLGHEVGSIVVGISGKDVEGLKTQGFRPILPRGRIINAQDVLEVLNHSRSLVLPPDREQVQAIPREFRVDGQRDVRNPAGMSGDKLEVITYVITSPVSVIQNLENVVNRTGHTVEQMAFKALASGLGVLTPEELEMGTVVVDIGAGTTDVAVFAKGSLAYAASLPLGGAAVTSDLSQLLRTSPEEAERLKLTHGACLAKNVSPNDSVDVNQIGQPVARPMQRRVLCEIIESRMREIAKMVSQHVEKSGIHTAPPGGLVLTGGGAWLADSNRLFEAVLPHMTVRVAEPDLGSKFGRQPGLATVIGLARFASQCQDEIMPATGMGGWKDRVRGLFGILGR